MTVFRIVLASGLLTALAGCGSSPTSKPASADEKKPASADEKKPAGETKSLVVDKEKLLGSWECVRASDQSPLLSPGNTVTFAEDGKVTINNHAGTYRVAGDTIKIELKQGDKLESRQAKVVNQTDKHLTMDYLMAGGKEMRFEFDKK